MGSNNGFNFYFSKSCAHNICWVQIPLQGILLYRSRHYVWVMGSTCTSVHCTQCMFNCSKCTLRRISSVSVITIFSNIKTIAYTQRIVNSVGITASPVAVSAVTLSTVVSPNLCVVLSSPVLRPNIWKLSISGIMSLATSRTKVISSSTPLPGG